MKHANVELGMVICPEIGLMTNGLLDSFDRWRLVDCSLPWTSGAFEEIEESYLVLFYPDSLRCHMTSRWDMTRRGQDAIGDPAQPRPSEHRS